MPRAALLSEVGWAFLKLGCTSFGGPIAHLGYLRAEIVERRKWTSDERYADLVALCQFLPGPASSQVVFALGMERAGLLGALLASFFFTAPSALLMIAFAYGIRSTSSLQSAGWLHGLKLAAVVVVAQAVWGMGKNLCPDRTRISLCLISAASLLVVPHAWMQILTIVVGGVFGYLHYQSNAVAPASREPSAFPERHAKLGLAAFAFSAFLALLIALPIARAATQNFWMEVCDGFYRSGSIVFGGGHVVLPLLRAEVVSPGWLSDDQFLAGYAAAQALPGPLFAFAAYLGTTITAGPQAWSGGLLCLVAIFLPGWLLVLGALPFWQRLRQKLWAQAALMGANAAVVGVLLAAFYDPVFVQGVRSRYDAAAALVAFCLLEKWACPPWMVVLALAAFGQLMA